MHGPGRAIPRKADLEHLEFLPTALTKHSIELVLTFSKRCCLQSPYKDRQSGSSPLSLSLPDEGVLFHFSVSSQIDYCYALFAGLLVPARTINRLQLVQKAASHILPGTRWSKHITRTGSATLTGCHIQQQVKALLASIPLEEKLS